MCVCLVRCIFYSYSYQATNPLNDYIVCVVFPSPPILNKYFTHCIHFFET